MLLLLHPCWLSVLLLLLAGAAVVADGWSLLLLLLHPWLSVLLLLLSGAAVVAAGWSLLLLLLHPLLSVLLLLLAGAGVVAGNWYWCHHITLPTGAIFGAHTQEARGATRFNGKHCWPKLP